MQLSQRQNSSAITATTAPRSFGRSNTSARNLLRSQVPLSRRKGLHDTEDPRCKIESSSRDSRESKYASFNDQQPVKRIPPKPMRMTRAREWSKLVEDNHRLQCVGWRDVYEYCTVYGEPERWGEDGFIKCLRVKQNGYYTYWRNYRECEDKLVRTVKLYEY